MHTLQVMAVSAATVKEASAAVEEYLADRPDITDWFSCPGRFADVLGADGWVPGTDERVVPLLAEVESRQRARWDFLRQSVIGDDATLLPPAVPASEAGYPNGSPRWGTISVETAGVLLSPSLPPLGGVATRTGLTFSQLASVLFDEHTTDSGFFDLSGCSTRLDALRERLACRPQREFLFAMDLHS